MKILILGATGMLGHTLFYHFSSISDYTVLGTVRSDPAMNLIKKELRGQIINDVDAFNYQSILTAITSTRPDFVINCIGLIKQKETQNYVTDCIELNALLPHRLTHICELIGAKLIHFSTDCVFSGSKGNYVETDLPDASDVYGKTKFLGEVNKSSVLSIRTSIIGHEIQENKSLVEWFFAQKGSVPGFCKAVFSGLPTIEVAEILQKIIENHQDLYGLYHLASHPISKFELLNIISEVYKFSIEITPANDLVIDRSLNMKMLYEEIKYTPPSWSQLIKKMKFNKQGA